MSALTDSADVFMFSTDPATDRLVFGTAEIGNIFGQLKSASLERKGDEELIKNNKGSLRAFLIKNPGFDLQITVYYSGAVVPPGLMTPITFPAAGVTGHISNCKIEWDEDGTRMLTCTAKQWDSLTGGTVTKWNGLTHTAV